MAIRNDLTNTWSTAIGPLTYDCPVQCRKGFVFLSWTASAPGTIQDSLMLGPGDVFILPAGSSFRMAVNTSTDHEVFYQEFTA